MTSIHSRFVPQLQLPVLLALDLPAQGQPSYVQKRSQQLRGNRLVHRIYAAQELVQLVIRIQVFFLLFLYIQPFLEWNVLELWRVNLMERWDRRWLACFLLNDFAVLLAHRKAIGLYLEAVVLGHFLDCWSLRIDLLGVERVSVVLNILTVPWQVLV